MAKDPQKLVELVTREVVKALQQRDGRRTPKAGNTAAGQQPAHIQPPIGQCTGDYSKFPELRGKLTSEKGSDPVSISSQAVGEPTSEYTSNDPAPLTGFVTANQLQQAIAASSEGVALLAPDAKLTPLANDFVRHNPDSIRRASSLANRPGSNKQANNLSWLWWIDGNCPAAQQITTQRAANMKAMSMSRTPTALAQVVRELAQSIKTGSVHGGILFVHNAARAMCFANRCASIRAVVGTCGEAVEQGIAELGTNVLVIEYPHQGPKAMQAMVDRMMQQPPQLSPSVQRELADLHRCG